MNQVDDWNDEFEPIDHQHANETYSHKLPVIKFKDNIKEEEKKRFVIYFSLIFAIIGAIIVVAIPVEFLLPKNVGIGDLDISSKLPLLQTVAGAVIGSFVGAVIGFILDLFLNAFRLNAKTK